MHGIAAKHLAAQQLEIDVPPVPVILRFPEILVVDSSKPRVVFLYVLRSAVYFASSLSLIAEETKLFINTRCMRSVEI